MTRHALDAWGGRGSEDSKFGSANLRTRQFGTEKKGKQQDATGSSHTPLGMDTTFPTRKVMGCWRGKPSRKKKEVDSKEKTKIAPGEATKRHWTRGAKVDFVKPEG